MAIQGLTGSTYDGVTLRTAKFAMDKFVPVVGGMFSGTMDTLIGCSLVVKNGVGVMGLILIACKDGVACHADCGGNADVKVDSSADATL